jgi:hypothetical protein
MRGKRATLTRIPLAFFLAAMVSQRPGAEVSVTVTPPEFVGGNAFLGSSFDAVADTLTDRINGYLDDEWLRKPRFMKAFGDAAAYALLVPGAVPSVTVPFVDFGVAASAWVDPLGRETVKMVRRLDANSDESMGASARPFVVSFGIPLDRLKRGLSAGGTFGYMAMSDTYYRASSLSVCARAAYTTRGARFGVASWDGFALRAETGGTVDAVTATYSFGDLSESVSLDEDGGGPLPPFSATARVSPDVVGKADISTLSVCVRASSSVTLIDAVTLFAGVGITAHSGTARIRVSLDEEIELDGYAATLVREPGRVTVSGDVAKETTSGLGSFLEGGLQLRAGALRVTIPVLWTPYYALATGVFLGVTF